MRRVGLMASLTVVGVVAAGGTAAALNARVLDPRSTVPVGVAEVFLPSVALSPNPDATLSDAPSTVDVASPSLTEVTSAPAIADPSEWGATTHGSSTPAASPGDAIVDGEIGESPTDVTEPEDDETSASSSNEDPADD